MWTPSIPLSLSILLWTAVTCDALKLPLQSIKSTSTSFIQRRSGRAPVVNAVSTDFKSHNKVLASADGIAINTVRDLIYLTNVTIGGTDYVVQLDTGSSDLWVVGQSTPLPNSKPTAQTYNLSYGIGWAYGNVSYAPVTFAGIDVPSQALLDVSAAQNPALSYGGSGILGLGFTSLSTIDYIVNQTHASTGRSLLYNLFAANPSEPNFIAFALQRSSDNTDSVVGSFAIGEYEEKYTNIVDSDPIPTWPVSNPSRWTILLDYILLGNNKTLTPTSNVTGAPTQSAVALMDSGTSYTYASPEICTALYGGISGASFNAQKQQWIVPCDAEVDVAFQINGDVYPLHPLDVVQVSASNSNTCFGSFIPQNLGVGNNAFDMIIGDNFLRSVYSIYDFGDFDKSGKMGNPYIKMLSLTDPNVASKDFHAARGGSSSGNISYTAIAGSASAGSGTTTVNVSDQVATVLTQISTYFPAVLGIMGLNILLLLIIVIVGGVFLCKRNKKKKNQRGRARMSPMPLNRVSRFGSSSTEDPAHNYEPVSMTNDDGVFSPLPAKSARYSQAPSSPDDHQSFITAASDAPPSARPLSSMPAPPPSILAPQRPPSILNNGSRPQSILTNAGNPRPQSTLSAGPRPQSTISAGPRPQSTISNAPRPSLSTHSRNTSLVNQGGPQMSSPLATSAVSASSPLAATPVINEPVPEEPSRQPTPTSANAMEALLQAIPPSAPSSPSLGPPTPPAQNHPDPLQAPVASPYSHRMSALPYDAAPPVMNQPQAHRQSFLPYDAQPAQPPQFEHQPPSFVPSPFNDPAEAQGFPPAESQRWPQQQHRGIPDLPSAPSPPQRSPQRLGPQFNPRVPSRGEGEGADRPYSMLVGGNGDDTLMPPVPAFRQGAGSPGGSRPRSMA